MFKKCKKFLLIAIAIYAIVFYFIIGVIVFRKNDEFGNKRNTKNSLIDGRNLQHKIVHLDLKGAPPKLKYLKKWLVSLRKLGATGLLVEYEDMFPYEGALRNVSAYNAYDREELRALIRHATGLGFAIIPLVQTFGHLEMLLKLEEFQALREHSAFPDCLCPSRARSVDVVLSMVFQILEFHDAISPVQWFHIGCDEVYHIGSCELCRSRRLSKFDLYMDHVIQISQNIRAQYPNITILIWDDMLRAIPPLEIQKYDLNPLIEPVIWNYGSDIENLIPHHIIYKYAKTFQNVWIASAFKGADTETAKLPVLRSRYLNHFKWLNYVNGYKLAGSEKEFNFKGIIMTGWSRFNHFAALCELLPSSFPSLALNLILVDMFSTDTGPADEFHKNVFEKFESVLNCPNSNVRFNAENVMDNLIYLDNIEHNLQYCKFVGNTLYDKLVSLNKIEETIIQDLYKRMKYDKNGNLDFYVAKNFINPNYLFEMELNANKSLVSLNNWIKESRKVLLTLFDVFTSEEYIRYKMMPLKLIISDILKTVEKVKSKEVWERGPIMHGVLYG